MAMIHTPRRSRSRAGFTLMEVLLSAVLFSILSVSLYTTYHSMYRTMTLCHRGFNAQLDMLRLDKILLPLLMSASPQAQKNQDATFKGKEKSLVFTTLNNARYPKGASSIACVELKLEKKEGLTIIVNSYRFLSKDADQKQDQIYRFPRFEDIELRYYHETDQLREWDALEKGSLPSVVQLTAKVKDEGDRELSYVRYIPVPMVRDLPIAGVR